MLLVSKVDNCAFNSNDAEGGCDLNDDTMINVDGNLFDDCFIDGYVDIGSYVDCNAHDNDGYGNVVGQSIDKGNCSIGKVVDGINYFHSPSDNNIIMNGSVDSCKYDHNHNHHYHQTSVFQPTDSIAEPITLDNSTGVVGKLQGTICVRQNNID